MGVCPLESLYQRRGHLSPQPLEAGGSCEVADGSVVIIAGDAVVPGSLDVQGGKVEAGEGCVLLLEQMVGDLRGEKLVQGLH